MPSLISPELSRVILLLLIVSTHLKWRQLLTSIVPDPYLDEVFHIPQAQAYWNGKWGQWNPKITTPPGLYLFSYAVNSVTSWCSTKDLELGTEDLRFTNFLLLYLLLVALYVWTAVAKREVHHDAVMQREFRIVLFPLFFFFSGLYYTDLLSALTVVVTYVFWSASQKSSGSPTLYQSLHLVSGLAALATRQTNVFWVAVYLGGLQVVKTVKREAGVTRIHDPPMSEAFFEGQSAWTGLVLALIVLDFLITSISIAQNGISILPQLLVDLWPSLALMLSFAAFVLYNGGVVLGTCPSSYLPQRCTDCCRRQVQPHRSSAPASAPLLLPIHRFLLLARPITSRL